MPSTRSIFSLLILLAAVAAAGLDAASRVVPFEDDLLANKAQEMLTVDKDSLYSKTLGGIQYLAEVPFTGLAVAHYEDGQLASQTRYSNGRRNGQATRWFPNGQKSFETFYKDNQRHGITQTWWANGTLRASSNYIEGAADGLQQQWYKSGALFKALNVAHGKAYGLQRAWRENGKLYANYEAIDGRIYGLKRANLCFDLDGETIQTSFSGSQ